MQVAIIVYFQQRPVKGACFNEWPLAKIVKDISLHINYYKECLRDLWNKHFIKGSALDPDFNFEIDKAFSLVDQGLFDSLVIAKAYYHSIGKTPEGFYNQIVVIPKAKNIKAYCAKRNGITWPWQEIRLPIGNNVFNYIELFDWAAEEEMKCEFVRARLTQSDTLLDFIGFDFLFDSSEVGYYMKG